MGILIPPHCFFQRFSGVFRGVSTISALRPILCWVLLPCSPSFCCDSVSLWPRVEQDRKGAEGKLQQLVGNGILGCCKAALPQPVCRSGVLGCSGASLLCLLCSWYFGVLQGSSVLSFWGATKQPLLPYCLLLCQGSC